MVDPSVITKRVEQIEKHLERIRPFTHLSQDAFLNDNVAQDVVEYNLFQIVAGVCPEYPPRPWRERGTMQTKVPYREAPPLYGRGASII